MKINRYEYAFLQGDKVTWDCGGAAYNVVAGWLKNRGYGEFGKPTETGRAVMLEYERMIDYDV